MYYRPEYRLPWTVRIQRSLYSTTCLSCLDAVLWSGSSSNLYHRYDIDAYWLPRAPGHKRHAVSGECKEHATACGKAFPSSFAPWPVSWPA